MWIYGLDVSSWQKRINWDGARDSDFAFVLIRVAVQDREDTRWRQHYEGARRVNMLVGAYFAVDPNLPILPQFRKALEIYTSSKWDLPLFLDAEIVFYSKPSTWEPVLNEWLQFTKERNFNSWGIYTNYYFANANHFFKVQELANYPLWIACWGCSRPLVPKPWTSWTLWQYEVTAPYRFRWYRGRLDLNKTTQDRFDRLRALGYNPRQEPTNP